MYPSSKQKKGSQSHLVAVHGPAVATLGRVADRGAGGDGAADGLLFVGWVGGWVGVGGWVVQKGSRVALRAGGGGRRADGRERLGSLKRHPLLKTPPLAQFLHGLKHKTHPVASGRRLVARCVRGCRLSGLEDGADGVGVGLGGRLVGRLVGQLDVACLIMRGQKTAAPFSPLPRFHLNDVGVREGRGDGGLHDGLRGKRREVRGGKSFFSSGGCECRQTTPAPSSTPPHPTPHPQPPPRTIFSLFSAPLMLAGRIIVFTATTVPRHEPL
jgi:hypothetical protein